MPEQTPKAAVTLDTYLAARDNAIALNSKLVTARKEIESAKRRVARLETEAHEAEAEALNLKKQLDAATPKK